MSGQTMEAFGEGERFPVTKQLIVTIKRHVNDLKDTDISGYTFERRRSVQLGVMAGWSNASNNVIGVCLRCST